MTTDDTPNASRCDSCGGYAHVCTESSGRCRFWDSAFAFFRERERSEQLPDSLARLLRATEDAAWLRLSKARIGDHLRATEAILGFYGDAVCGATRIGPLVEQAVRDLESLTGATVCPNCGLTGEERECPSCQDAEGGCPTLAISPEAARVFEKLAAQRLGLFDAVTDRDRLKRRLVESDAAHAEHLSHVRGFLRELYAIMVDPLADGGTKIADATADIMRSALWQRERIAELETANAELRRQVYELARFIERTE